MKSLSLPTPLVIIMAGLPGAGKSFFARQFSDTFGAPLVSIDRLRYEIFEAPSYSAQEQVMLHVLAEYQLDETLKTKQTVIMDGYFATRADRQQIEKTAKKHNYKTLIVWVQTDDATAKHRATKRTKAMQNETLSRNLNLEQYAQQVKRFTPPTANEPYVVVSGKHTYATQAKIILKKLAAPREEAAPRLPIREQSAPLQPQRRNITIS